MSDVIDIPDVLRNEDNLVDELRKEIRDLKHDNARLMDSLTKEVNRDEWISVKSRLPKENDIIDVWRRPAFSRVGFRVADVNCTEGRFFKETYTADSTGCCIGLEEVEDVTHYIPKPAGPKDKDNDNK